MPRAHFEKKQPLVFFFFFGSPLVPTARASPEYILNLQAFMGSMAVCTNRAYFEMICAHFVAVGPFSDALVRRAVSVQDASRVMRCRLCDHVLNQPFSSRHRRGSRLQVRDVSVRPTDSP